MKRLGPSTAALIALASVGLADSTYLTINSLFSKVQLVCPSVGIINCGLVTSSPYAHVFGIPVALLGLLWFAAILTLGLSKPSFRVYLLLPLWLAGIIMVGYLIYVEAFLLHAICLYCTLAHICTALIGIPVVKLTLAEA
jgi:uncharacterized membrane protein